MGELDLKELFNIFWDKKIDIIIIIITLMIIGILYSFILVTPKYTSYTTMVLTQTGSSGSSEESSITQTDIALNSKLVSTYSSIIESKSVLDKVVENLDNPELTRDNIKNCINVKAVSDTELIKIEVTHENPEYAADITNEIAKVFSEKVVEIYNLSNVYVLDVATPDDVPSNINHAKDIIIFIFIGVVIACGYVLIANMLDTTIKTEEDVEKTTGLLVLASIPDYELENRGGKR